MKVALLAWYLCSAVLLAQNGSFSIDGTVVDSETGLAIPRARIKINCHAKEVHGLEGVARMARTEAMTDASGSFFVSGFSAATCYANATKIGFVVREVTEPIELTHSKSGLRVPLSRLGVITGIVIDQAGNPLRGVNVVLVDRYLDEGFFRLRNSRSVTTGDDGAYRLWNMAPGKYYLKATGQHGTTSLYSGSTRPSSEIYDAFVPTYSDGSRSILSATPLVMGVGSQLRADIRLKLEQTFTLRGTLQNFAARKTVKFELLRDGEPASPVRAVLQMDSGQFELREVAAGNYLLRATQDERIGDLPVSISSDLSGLSVVLHTPVSLAYSTRFTAPPPQGEDRFRVADCRPRLVSADLRTVVDARGTDPVLSGIYPGEYNLRLTCLDAYPRSVLSGNQDLLVNPTIVVSAGVQLAPIEIVAVRRGARLTVKRSEPNKSAKAALLVPQFASAGPMFSTVPDQSDDGEFYFVNLAPGNWSLYLFNDPEIEYRNPRFLQALTGGERITLGEDERKEHVFTGAPR